MATNKQIDQLGTINYRLRRIRFGSAGKIDTQVAEKLQQAERLITEARALAMQIWLRGQAATQTQQEDSEND